MTDDLDDTETQPVVIDAEGDDPEPSDEGDAESPKDSTVPEEAQ